MRMSCHNVCNGNPCRRNVSAYVHGDLSGRRTPYHSVHTHMASHPSETAYDPAEAKAEKKICHKWHICDADRE